MPAPRRPFSGDELKKRGIQNISDLNDVLPGLTVANNGANREVWIRGIGSSNNTELGDPAAATHWDGVYLPRPSGIGSAFFDIQRVEVNVGPQGTLRGRNATAGSVNVITWKPGLGVWDAELEGEYGNYNQKVVRGMLNVPIGETAALRLSGMGLSHDSYYKNVGPVRDIDVAEAEDNIAGRAQILWEPSDRWRFLIAGDYMHETGTGWTGTNYANPLGNGIDPERHQGSARRRRPRLHPGSRHQALRASVVEITYDAGPFKIDYVGSYRHVDFGLYGSDPDRALIIRRHHSKGLPNFRATLTEELDNFSRFQSLQRQQVALPRAAHSQRQGTVGLEPRRECISARTNMPSSARPAIAACSSRASNSTCPTSMPKSYGGFGDATYSVDAALRG